MKATGTYSPTRWDEKPYEQISDDQKLTRATVEFEFSGEITGKASVEYLMYYKSFDSKDAHKSSAQYVGLIRLVGTLNGKAGSLVMEDRGTFDAGAAKSSLHIITGSGTGELKGITGTGRYTASQDGCSCELNYEL